MKSVFLDNQAVGAADLNQIAIDLGKGTFSNFDDGTAYGVDDLNSITKDIVSSGIVVGDGKQCLPELILGNVTVDTGLCVFQSGAKIRISQKQNLIPDQNQKQYIYLLNDVALNSVELIIGKDNPAEIDGADYVPLAIYREDNTLIDQRAFATAKVTIPSANQYRELEASIFFSGNDNFEERYLLADWGIPFRYVGVMYSENDGAFASVNGGSLFVKKNQDSCVLAFEQEGTTIYFRKDNRWRGGETLDLKFVFF